MADTTQFRNYTTRYDPGMGLDLICDALNLGLYIGVDAAADATPTISSAIIKFLQSGTGAVAEDAQTVLRRFVWVEQFGASPSASAATNSTAIAAAITAAVANKRNVRFAQSGTYSIASAVSQPASVEVDLCGATIDANAIASGTIWTITAGGDGVRTKVPLKNGTLLGVSSPGDGVYNSSLNGINFQTSSLEPENVIVKGCGSAYHFDSNAYLITLFGCAAYYNVRAWDADASGKTNMGSSLNAVDCLLAHNDYDIYNNLCESTFTRCAFDTPQKGVVEDNITASGGVNNSELVWQDCRTEGGGSASYAYITNSGLMVLRDHKFIAASAYTYLFDNSGQITIQGGLSRIVGDTYTSRNTGSGTITINGIRTSDLNGQNFRLSADESQIYNSDAEDTTTDGWVVTTGSSSNFTNIGTDGYQGSRCFNAVSGGAAFALETWGIPIPPGTKKLLLNAYFKNDNSTTVYPTLAYYNEADTQILTEYQSLAASTSTWTRLRFGDANVVPKGAAYAKLTLSMGLAETSYVRIDDLYVNFW